ncbi:MAG: folate-binding protein YgfZ [Alphaproteobacteria bacterium]|nr:folate-binding protein YgfZ [Alphaproteobacteria bacterium]
MQLIDHSRALISIVGEDASSFLQGIITQDIANADHAPIFSAMLSPQGKWNYDFFIIKRDDGYWLDVRNDTAEALIKKLSLYKLRAKVTISKCEGWCLSYLTPQSQDSSHLTFADPRHAILPLRHWRNDGTANPAAISLDHLVIERLNHGIPEGGIDATEQETLLDVGYDLLNAVSFTKGCYVGQEVTARMHYKSIARKGFYHVQCAEPLPAEDKDILRDGKVIGELRSRHLNQGLMFARFDMVGDGGEALIGNLAVTLTLPTWLEPRYQMHLKNQEA